MITSGKYELGPDHASLRLHTYREGMAKKVGHDLILEVGSWYAVAEVDADDMTRSTMTASADPRSITVLEGTGGVKPVSDGDRAAIKKNMDKVLQTGKHPEITFRSTRVESQGPDRFAVHGDLTLAGTTRPAVLDVTLQPGGAQVTTSLVQSNWGIKPYSGLMGALKVRDEVELRVESTLPTPEVPTARGGQ